MVVFKFRIWPAERILSDKMYAYISSIWSYRYFWFSLVQNDLRQRYRGSVLGMGWSLLHPIAMTVILCVVFGSIFHQDYRFFGPFLLAGMAVWNFLTQSITAGCNSFFMAEAYIRQQPIPMAIYPLRTVLGLGFHFLIGMGLVVALSLWFLGWPGIAPFLSIIPSMTLIFLFAWSLSCIFGLATVYFRDTKHLSEVGLQILFYLTPVMYPPSVLEGRRLGILLKFNPLSPFLELIRDPLIYQKLPSSETFGMAFALTLIAMVVAYSALKASEKRIIFHL